MSISARMIECPLCREKAQAVEDLSELRRVYTCPNCGRFEHYPLVASFDGFNMNHLSSYFAYNHYSDDDPRYFSTCSKEICAKRKQEFENCLYSGFVFCTGDGKVYLPNAINRTIRSICADYNKEEESKAKEENRDPVFLPKFSCHILRHTFCTRFCENETNLKVIQEIMGHADISTTMDVYAEATQEKKKESMTSLQSALLVR